MKKCEIKTMLVIKIYYFVVWNLHSIAWIKEYQMESSKILVCNSVQLKSVGRAAQPCVCVPQTKPCWINCGLLPEKLGPSALPGMGDHSRTPGTVASFILGDQLERSATFWYSCKPRWCQGDLKEHVGIEFSSGLWEGSLCAHIKYGIVCLR